MELLKGVVLFEPKNLRRKEVDILQYDTVEYQRRKTLDCLGFGIVSAVGLGLVAWLDSKSLFGYILAFGVVIGVIGGYEHYRYMKELKGKHSGGTVQKEKNESTSLLELLELGFEPAELEGITEEQLEPLRREIEVSCMAATFGDPRGFADLRSELRPAIRRLKSEEV